MRLVGSAVSLLVSLAAAHSTSSGSARLRVHRSATGVSLCAIACTRPSSASTLASSTLAPPVSIPSRTASANSSGSTFQVAITGSPPVRVVALIHRDSSAGGVVGAAGDAAEQVGQQLVLPPAGGL